MTVDAHDGAATIITVAFVVGASLGMMTGILGTLCVTTCFRKKKVEPTVVERIPEPTIVERVVEVERRVQVPMPIAPQDITVSLTKDCYAYHDRHNKVCKYAKEYAKELEWRGASVKHFEWRGASVKHFVPCMACFKTKRS